MNILVCLKQTFDTEEKIEVKNGKISDASAEFILNPYDEYAVEEAVQHKEAQGGKVTVVTVAPARAETALRTALAMGADEAIIVDDEEQLSTADEYSISKVLAVVARRDSYDLILAGYMAVDNGSAQVGPRLAEELGIPHVITATSLAIEGNTVTVKKDVEGDAEIIQASLPILITAQQGLNEPRYPSLPSIMKAKKKPMERLTLTDLGIDANTIKAKTSVIEQYLPQAKEAGKILEGEIDDQVRTLIDLLRTKAKVI